MKHFVVHPEEKLRGPSNRIWQSELELTQSIPHKTQEQLKMSEKHDVNCGRSGGVPSFWRTEQKTGNTAKLQEKAQCIQVASSGLSCLRSHPAHWFLFHLNIKWSTTPFTFTLKKGCSNHSISPFAPSSITSIHINWHIFVWRFSRSRGVCFSTPLSSSCLRPCHMLGAPEDSGIGSMHLGNYEFWWCFLYFIYLEKF